MERFAIKIDERVKLNLYNICRLCGIDNRDQVPIVDDPDGTFTIEDEPSLCKKIIDCVGIQVTSTDKLPQKICTLCVDKINDFYEYREMCKATNFQTRELLGLPPEDVKDEKPPLQQDPPPMLQQPSVELPATGTAMKRKRKLKSECVSYEEVDDDEIDEKPPKKKIPKPSVGAAKKKFLPARKILVKRESVKALPSRILPNREKPIPLLREKAIPILREKSATLNNKEKLLTPPIKEKALALREKSIGLREKVLTLKEKSTPVKEKPTIIKEKPMTVKEKQLLLKEKTIKEKVVTPPVKENRLVTREKLQAAKEKLTPPIKEKPILIKEKPQKAILEKEKLKPGREKILNSKLPILNAKQNKEKGIIKEKLNVSVEDKKNEPTSSKIDTDLITLKTPNRRERQRELETKKKRKVPVLPPVEKVKTENLFPCIVCPKDFKTQPEYDLHFFREHTPNTLEHGCSACREAFYDLQEYRDHQLWHRLSSISFSCFKCNSQFDRITGYTRHFLTSCVPPTEYDIVDDIKCPKCQKTFVTKNLYEWHGCLIKNNTKCPRCSKFFAKRLYLQRHVVICDGKKIEPKPVMAPAAPLRNKNTEPVEPEKTLTTAPTNDTNKIVKVEPESAVENDEETEVSVSNKDNDDEDRDIEDSVVDDVGFQDENDDAEDDTTANDSSVIHDSATVANDSDDDVIVISDNEELGVLPVKQEKVDRRYEEVVSRASANIPMVQIKQEVLNSNYTDNNVDLSVLRNIKPEPAEPEPAISTEPVTTVSELNRSTDVAPSAPTVPESTNQTSKLAAAKPTLKLKIKKEHGTLNSSFIEPDENEDDSLSPNRSQTNDDETGNNPHRKRRNKHKKKIYKIPKQLALIIKQEKESRTESAENAAIGAESRITVPVISEVTSIAATVLDSRKQINQSDYFAEEEGPSMSASFPGDSLQTSTNTEPAVRETNIQIPVIAEVVSLKQSEPIVPLISSVTSLSQSSGIRVKTEFNNFLSPTSEEPTTIDSRIEQDDMITGNYHMEYDENPEHDFEHTDSEEVPLSTSKDSIESEIDEKPNLSELLKMSTVGQVSSSAIIKLEKSPYITEPSKEREPVALRVKNLESLKSKSQDKNCRQRPIEPNAEKTGKKRFAPTTTPQNASCDTTEDLGNENQSVGINVNIKLEPSDTDEFPMTDTVDDVNAEFQGSAMDLPIGSSDNLQMVKTESPFIESGDEFVPLDSAINRSVKTEPPSTESDGELYNMEEDDINLPTTETNSDHIANKPKAIETEVAHGIQNIKVEFPIADTGDDDVEMDITIDKSVNVKEEKCDEEGVGSESITNTMQVAMDDSENVERDTTPRYSELPTIETSGDRNVEFEASETNLPNVNQVDTVEQNNTLFPTLEADSNGVAELQASEVSLETKTTDSDVVHELKEKGTDQIFVGPDNVDTNVAAFPTTEMDGDYVNAEICGVSETNLPIGSTENVNATMPTIETSDGNGNFGVKMSQTDLLIDSTDNLEKIEVEFSKSETSVNPEVCDTCEPDLPLGSPDNVAKNETTEMADVNVNAEVCEAIETNLPIGSTENVNATFPTADSSIDGGNVEVKANQTDLPIDSADNLEKNEIEFRTSGTSDEICNACETDLPIGSPDNVTKDEEGFPTTEMTDGSGNAEVCEAIDTNLPNAKILTTDNSSDDGNVEDKVCEAIETNLPIGSAENVNTIFPITDSSVDGGNVEAKAYQTDLPIIDNASNLEKDEVEFPTSRSSDECVNVIVCDACETDLPLDSPDNVTKDAASFSTTETTDASVNAEVFDAIETNLLSVNPDNTENVYAKMPTSENEARGSGNVEVKPNETDLPSGSVDNLEMDVSTSDACETELPISSQYHHDNDKTTTRNIENSGDGDNIELKASQTDLIDSTDKDEKDMVTFPTTEIGDAVVIEFKASEPSASVDISGNGEQINATISTLETDVDIVGVELSEVCEIDVVKSIYNSDVKTDNTQFQTTETDLVLPAQISVPGISIKRPFETDNDSEESKPKIQKMSECHLEITNQLELHDNEVILPKPDGLVTSVEALISEMEESGQCDTAPIETESNVAHNKNLNITENITYNQNIRNNQIIEKSPEIPEQENQIQQPFLIENKIIEEQDTTIQSNQDETNNIAENSTVYEIYAVQTNENLHQEINDKQLLESSITTKENNFSPIKDVCDIDMGVAPDLENVDYELKNKYQCPIQQEEFSVPSAMQHDESHYNENDVNMETEESNIDHVCTNEDVAMQPHGEVCNMEESDVIENIIIQPEAVNAQISNHIEKETDNSMIVFEQVLPAPETSSSNLSENFEEGRPAKEENYEMNVISGETCSTIEAATQESRISEILDSELINKEQEESLKNPVDEEQSQQGLDIINELNVLNCESRAVVMDENMSDVNENVGPLCSTATERRIQSDVEECEQCPDLIEQFDELNGDSSGSINVEKASDVKEEENVCLTKFENDKPLGELNNPEESFYKPDSNKSPFAEAQPMTQEANQYTDLDETTDDRCTSSSEENNSGLPSQEERTAQQENMDDDNTSTTISDIDTPLEDLTKSDENLYESDCIIVNTEGPAVARVESNTNEIHQCPDVIIEISDDSSESSMEQDTSDETLSENLHSKIQTEAVQLTLDGPVNYVDEISDDSCEYSMEEESTNTPLNVVSDYINQPQEDNYSTSMLDTEKCDHAKQTENLNNKLTEIIDDSSASPKPESNSEDNTELSYSLGSSSEMHEENTKVTISSDSSSHSPNSESEKNVADTLDFIKPVVMSTFEVPSCYSTDAIDSVSSLQIQHEARQILVNPSIEYQTIIASNIETVVENVPSNLDAVTAHENLNVNLDGQTTNSSLAAVSKANEKEDIDSDLEKELLEEIQ